MTPKTDKSKSRPENEQFVEDVERKQIAKRLKEARAAKKLSQNQLAEKAGISRSTVMHYEKAKAAPGAMELLRLANALNMSPNQILSGRDRFKKKSNDDSSTDLSLDPSDLTGLATRVTTCLAVLAPEVRENFYNLLLSMVKETIGHEDYKKFLLMFDAMAPTVTGMAPAINTLAEEHFDADRLEEINNAIESEAKK